MNQSFGIEQLTTLVVTEQGIVVNYSEIWVIG